MKKGVVALVVGIFLLASLGAQAVGGGISFFMPETLYKYGRGTIGFEQGLSTSLGIGSLLSIPIGFAYHSSDGYTVEGTGLQTVNAPTLYGDLIMPYVQLKMKVPIGPLYLEAWGGGALGWAFSLNPTGDFTKLLQTDSDPLALGTTDIRKKLGYGWMAGGAIGVQIDAVGVDLGVSYRDIKIPLEGTVQAGAIGSGLTTYTLDDSVKAILRGLSFRIGGSFSFGDL